MYSLEMNPEPGDVLDKLYDENLPLYDAIEDALDHILSDPTAPEVLRHPYMMSPPRFVHPVHQPAGVQDWMILWRHERLEDGTITAIIEYIGPDELLSPPPTA